MDRRAFLKAAIAAPPLVGDVISPFAVGILNHKNQSVLAKPNGQFEAILFFYGRTQVEVAPDQVRDDEGLRKLIKAEADNVAEALYHDIKSAASDPNHIAWANRAYTGPVRYDPQWKRVEGEFVKRYP